MKTTARHELATAIRQVHKKEQYIGPEREVKAQFDAPNRSQRNTVRISREIKQQASPPAMSFAGLIVMRVLGAFWKRVGSLTLLGRSALRADRIIKRPSFSVAQCVPGGRPGVVREFPQVPHGVSFHECALPDFFVPDSTEI